MASPEGKPMTGLAIRLVSLGAVVLLPLLTACGSGASSEPAPQVPLGTSVALAIPATQTMEAEV